MALSLDRDRFVATMREQAEIGATDDGGLHRLALSDADREVRDWFVAQLEDAGLTVRVDAFGNVFGRREGADADAAPVLLGSHLDSQPNGGIYDGALGVVAALEFVRTLNDEGVETERPVELVNWTNEEGSRFQPAMQGAGVWAGAHDIAEEYDKRDADGNRLEDELERIGYRGDEPCEPREEYAAALELHIEQGPRLAQGDERVGVVTGIVGFAWAGLTFEGQANHSGTTPMHHRRDALVAAADVVTQVRRTPGTLGADTVGTVGSLRVAPDSINVVPETVEMTVGFRDPDDDVVDEAVARTLAEAERAAEREGCDWAWEERMRSPSVDFADVCVDAVAAAADAHGYPSRALFSGAGHDAAHTASVCDTGMVFVPSRAGMSHTPDEFTSWDDCHAGANVLADAALRLAGRTD